MRCNAVATLFALACATAVLAAAAGPAVAGPLATHASLAVTAKTVVLVHDDRDDRYYGRRYHHHRRLHVVDAPFTHVESRGYRSRVAVDAPFASVRVSRHGTWVRAPFVDLFVPD